ncbi:MAG: YceH family protein [Nitrospirae bacterium]|nr:YceH family protein [Nitrospirota bacterium]
MNLKLDNIQVRILASLIEKKITTPEYYPLTLKSLTAACNQKSNRYPVVSYDEDTVLRGLESLHKAGLIEKIYKAESRVPKYQHLFTEAFPCTRGEVAILCELMLRRGQTCGELRGRTERLYRFGGVIEVEEALNALMSRDEPAVVKLPRQPGRKEQRYMHLFSELSADVIQDNAPLDDGAAQAVTDDARISILEDKIIKLSGEVEALRKVFEEFRAEFG